jgi:hypothetical protein
MGCPFVVYDEIDTLCNHSLKTATLKIFAYSGDMVLPVVLVFSPILMISISIATLTSRLVYRSGVCGNLS